MVLTHKQNTVIHLFYGQRDRLVPMWGSKEFFCSTDFKPTRFRRSAMRLLEWSSPTVISRYPRTGEERRASCWGTNRRVEKIRRMPRRKVIIDCFYGVALDSVARRWALRMDQRGFLPIRKRTSDNGVHVRQNGLSRCAAALPYVAGFLVAALFPVCAGMNR